MLLSRPPSSENTHNNTKNAQKKESEKKKDLLKIILWQKTKKEEREGCGYIFCEAHLYVFQAQSKVFPLYCMWQVNGAHCWHTSCLICCIFTMLFGAAQQQKTSYVSPEGSLLNSRSKNKNYHHDERLNHKLTTD